MTVTEKYSEKKPLKHLTNFLSDDSIVQDEQGVTQVHTSFTMEYRGPRA